MATNVATAGQNQGQNQRKIASRDAEPAATATKKKKKTADPQPEAPYKPRGTSRDNREALTFGVAPELGFVNGAGYGARAMFFLGRNWQAEASYMHSEFSFLGDGVASDLASMRAKWFVGNTFYLGTGPSFRKLTTTQTIGFPEQKDVFLESDAGADFAIGNEWQWSSFMLGVDWAGYYQPLAAITKAPKEERNANGIITAKGVRGESTNSGSLELVRLHVGVGF